MRALTFLVALALGGCFVDVDVPGEPISCTQDLRAGLGVQVVNDAGVRIAAEVIAYDGAYEEVLEQTSAGTYWGAWERAGTYDLLARSPGHVDTWLEGVEVRADECHVIPVQITITMRRDDAPPPP